MSATPRPHFEEIDWLDFVEGSAEPPRADRMREHLSECETCRRRVESMRLLADAIPIAGRLVEAGPISASTSDPDWIASARAAAGVDEVGTARERIREAFSGGGGSYSWTPVGFEAARGLARELLRSDVAMAGRIVRSALSALPSSARGEHAGGLEGVLRTVLAYVLHGEGDSEGALEELARARPDIENGSAVPEDDLAFWSYVSGQALRALGRTQAALESLDTAADLCRLLEDFPREARCRIARATIVADLGRPEESIRVYEELLSRERELEDVRLVGMICLNLGSDLIHVNRLSEAKRAYARAADILRKAGEGRRLLAVRAGLATVASREGRYEDAYKIALELREGFRSAKLGWDEISTELRIADILLHLGRGGEAAETCRNLLPRIRELGLSAEAERAVAYLAEAELDLERVEKVRVFLQKVKRGEDVRWSAA